MKVFITSAIFSVLLFAAPETVFAEPALGSAAGYSGSPMDTGFMLKFLLGLVAVLVCMMGMAWMMRRFGRLQASVDGSLRILGGLALSTRERVVLVQVGEEQVLLGVAPGRVESVHVLREPIDFSSSKERTENNFAGRLKQALNARSAP